MKVQALQEMRDVTGTKVGSAGRIRLQEAAEVLDDRQPVVIVASSAAPAKPVSKPGPEDGVGVRPRVAARSAGTGRAHRPAVVRMGFAEPERLSPVVADLLICQVLPNREAKRAVNRSAPLRW
jgi:hypothetical protein